MYFFSIISSLLYYLDDLKIVLGYQIFCATTLVDSLRQLYEANILLFNEAIECEDL